MKIIYSTFSGKESAKKAARILVENKLAACCNFFEINSVYEWQGKVKDSGEIIMLIKTSDSKLEGSKAKLEEIHEYECPCIFVIEPESVNADFGKWIDETLNAS